MVRLFHTAPTQRPSATVYATSISARPPEPMSERRQSKMVAAVLRTRSENRPTPASRRPTRSWTATPGHRSRSSPRSGSWPAPCSTNRYSSPCAAWPMKRCQRDGETWNAPLKTKGRGMPTGERHVSSAPRSGASVPEITRATATLARPGTPREPRPKRTANKLWTPCGTPPSIRSETASGLPARDQPMIGLLSGSR